MNNNGLSKICLGAIYSTFMNNDNNRQMNNCFHCHKVSDHLEGTESRQHSEIATSNSFWLLSIRCCHRNAVCEVENWKETIDLYM